MERKNGIIMKYIESFREGDKINDVYLCKYKQSATAKNGKMYENVILQDKTGTIDAKVWDRGIRRNGLRIYHW